MKIAIAIAACFATSASAEAWSLSGTVRDAEDGSHLKNVRVALAVAGLSDSTDKDGKWTLGTSSGILLRGTAPNGIDPALSMLNGHIQLRLDGRDILGRGLPQVSREALRWWAARATGTVSDTLVYSKSGFVTRRVAIYAANQTGFVDSLHRVRGSEWVDSSHANRKPDSLAAFTGKVRTVTFHWTKQNWDRMMKAMADSCGKFGTGSSSATSKACKDGQYDLIEKSALIWVPADIETDGQIWKNVAIRLKGNASLLTSWSAKNYALPFRINTDKFEDSFPTIKDQRFYGFKKISFYNSQQDSTSIRGPVAGEIFRQFGVPTPLSVPTHVILKFGDTTKDVGAYEMLEVPDNPLLTRNFQNDSGNLYKPLSKLDQYVASEWEDEDVPGDRSDAKALIAAINASTRTSDSAGWHRTLESKIDVDGFLKWLAASTAIMNWDAYGNLSHNYYLFNDKGRFRFITYDFGWSFDYQMATSGIVSRTSIWYEGQAGGMMNLGPFPLVKNLMADKGYCETYRKYMTQVIAGPASVASFQAKVDKYGAWVSSVPSTVHAVSTLRGFMTGRIAEVQTSLGNKTCPVK